MLERGDDEALAAATAALRRSQLRALVRGFALASLGVCAVVVASTSAWGASAPPVLAAGAHTPARYGATRGAGGGWRVAPAAGGDDRYAATASFSPAAAHASGFGELRVRSLRGAGNFSEEDRAFAAGVLEGYLTAQKIVETGKNLACEVRCDGSVPPGVRGFFRAGLGAYVVNGPTNAGQPTFKWSDITVVSDLSNASGSPNSEAFNGAGLRLDLSASHLGHAPAVKGNTLNVPASPTSQIAAELEVGAAKLGERYGRGRDQGRGRRAAAAAAR